MRNSSVEGPECLLRLDLSLQSASQPDDQELTESDAYSNTSHCVEVVVDQTLKPDRIINTGGGEIEWSHLNSLDTPPGVDPLQNFSLLFDIVSTFLVSLGGSHLEATHEVEGDNTVLLDMTAGVWDSTPRLWTRWVVGFPELELYLSTLGLSLTSSVQWKYSLLFQSS